MTTITIQREATHIRLPDCSQLGTAGNDAGESFADSAVVCAGISRTS